MPVLCPAICTYARNVQEALSKLRVEHNSLVASTSSSATELERTSLHLEGLKSSHSELEKKHAESERTVADLRRQLEKWRNLEGREGAEVDNLRRSRIELEVRVKELESRVEELEEESGGKDEYVEKQRAKVARYKTMLEEYKVSFSEYQVPTLHIALHCDVLTSYRLFSDRKHLTKPGQMRTKLRRMPQRYGNAWRKLRLPSKVFSQHPRTNKWKAYAHLSISSLPDLIPIIVQPVPAKDPPNPPSISDHDPHDNDDNDSVRSPSPPPKKKKGRPRKVTTPQLIDITEEEPIGDTQPQPQEVKKKRGRPKKKPVQEGEGGAGLAKPAAANKGKRKATDADDSDDEPPAKKSKRKDKDNGDDDEDDDDDDAPPKGKAKTKKHTVPSSESGKATNDKPAAPSKPKVSRKPSMSGGTVASAEDEDGGDAPTPSKKKRKIRLFPSSQAMSFDWNQVGQVRLLRVLGDVTPERMPATDAAWRAERGRARDPDGVVAGEGDGQRPTAVCVWREGQLGVWELWQHGCAPMSLLGLWVVWVWFFLRLCLCLYIHSPWMNAL